MTALDAAADVSWDLTDLLDGGGDERVDVVLAEADSLADRLAATGRGRVGRFDGPALVDFMTEVERLRELLERAESYTGLRFVVDTTDAAAAALMQRAEERSTAIKTKMLFFELEWASLPDEQATELLATDGLDRSRHYLGNLRKFRPYLLSEPEERVITEKAVSGRNAWARLFSEVTSSLEVDLGDEVVPLEQGLSRLAHPDRAARQQAAAAITAALAPGLRTRAFIFNTLLYDKSIDDRLRGYPHWLATRNLDNEASDESVEALVAAVRKRNDIPQRWYTLKARLLGLDRIADYDRLASVASEDVEIGWPEAKRIVLESYESFSPDMASVAHQFFDRRWIDAPVRPGKRPGAFCAYTSPDVHPYVLLNYTARRNDVLTLAHELGHGIHAYLARGQGMLHQGTPLTVAETASVFGETVVFGRLLELADSPASRLSLLAENIEGAIATVFRQTAMNRFEDLVHTARRTDGELSVERFGELWAESQTEMLGDSVEITDGYRSWWSYIPHFISTPGYVYAYSYGQLLALSVYRQYEEQGSDFVPRYLHMLSAGGSMAPEELARIVGCDLADPSFWDGGLSIVESQLEAAESAAWEAGRLS